MKHQDELGFAPSCQGLYEYVRPKWQARPRPQVDEEKVKSFGTAVAPRPLNPLKGEQQCYSATGKLGEVELPRCVSVFVYVYGRYLFVVCSVSVKSPLPHLHFCHTVIQYRSYPQDVCGWGSKEAGCPICSACGGSKWQSGGSGWRREPEGHPRCCGGSPQSSPRVRGWWGGVHQHTLK